MNVVGDGDADAKRDSRSGGYGDASGGVGADAHSDKDNQQQRNEEQMNPNPNQHKQQEHAGSQTTQLHYNWGSPSIKRILKEVAQLQGDPHTKGILHAAPLEDNIFEWHFTLSGAEDSDFAGGLYHGRIILPPNYPMSPPSVVMLTPSGRFEVGAKICLSATAYHPEHWQPSWGVSTLLVALRSHMLTPAGGAIGALDLPSEVRRSFATKSRTWACPTCKEENQQLLPPPPTPETPPLPPTNGETAPATTIHCTTTSTTPSTPIKPVTQPPERQSADKSPPEIKAPIQQPQPQFVAQQIPPAMLFPIPQYLPQFPNQVLQNALLQAPPQQHQPQTHHHQQIRTTSQPQTPATQSQSKTARNCVDTLIVLIFACFVLLLLRKFGLLINE